MKIIHNLSNTPNEITKNHRLENRIFLTRNQIMLPFISHTMFAIYTEIILCIWLGSEGSSSPKTTMCAVSLRSGKFTASESKPCSKDLPSCTNYYKHYFGIYVPYFMLHNDQPQILHQDRKSLMQLGIWTVYATAS